MQFQILMGVFFLVIIQQCAGQSSPNCTKYYRNTHRHGAFLLGELTIPMSAETRRDDGQDGFKLTLKFNKAVRALSVRQAQARDMGSHQEYLIDATTKDGIMKLNTMVRLRSMLGHHLPKVTRIVFNNKSLCGAPLTEAELSESVIVSAKPESTSSSTVSSFKLIKDEDYYY